MNPHIKELFDLSGKVAIVTGGVEFYYIFSRQGSGHSHDPLYGGLLG